MQNLEFNELRLRLGLMRVECIWKWGTGIPPVATISEDMMRSTLFSNTSLDIVGKTW